MNQQKQKKFFFLIALISVIIFSVVAILIIIEWNTYYLELNIPNKIITLEYGVDEMPEVKALCKGILFNRKGTPISPTLNGELNLNALGVYNVTYMATYRNMSLTEERTIEIVDTTAPVIELFSNPDHFTSPVAQYEEEGFTATDNYDGDITDKVVRDEKDGIVTYTVVDSNGNKSTAKRTIIYKDVVPPSITLKGSANTKANIGHDYKDPGYKATDDVDGDITKSVKVDGTVDGYTKGTYTLTYQVSDSSGNPFEIKRTVVVKDIEAPKISLKGDANTVVKLGQSYNDPGFKASDNVDGDLTPQVIVTGKVNVNKVGTYTLTYKVSDTEGNNTTVERSVFVFDKKAAPNTVNPGNKVVYLTFDDGPSAHTSKLLNVLDKYGIKATFFVTNQYPKYRNMIGETYRRGHTIALHTYSHNYGKVYESENAYYSDLKKIEDIVVEQTGMKPTIVRFPGGTSNTVSKKYCPGIMTKLSKSLAYHGYLYCDWNVSSGDAGETTSTEVVYKNVVSGIKERNVSIVLQHDTTAFSVNAVEKIIQWGLSNGYTFLPMSDSTPMVHHKPNN